MVLIFTVSTPTIAALKTALVMLHLYGLILGLGGATLLDLLILKFFVCRKITSEQCAIVMFCAQVVSAGLLLLWISGLGFLAHYALFDPVKLSNPKIWAKLAIVSVLTINGVFIHSVVLPHVWRCATERQRLFDGLSATWRTALLGSGAVSALSWYAPFILGSVPQLNNAAPVALMLGAYAVALVLAVCAAVAGHALRRKASSDSSP